MQSTYQSRKECQGLALPLTLTLAQTQTADCASSFCAEQRVPQFFEVYSSGFQRTCKTMLSQSGNRLLRGARELDSAQSQPSSSASLVASPTNTPTPAKSFKEAVVSPARSSDCNNFEKGLAKQSSRSRNTSKGFGSWTERLRL